MRKELGLIVMGAVAFDLGTVVVPAQAADAIFLKIDGLSGESNYHKFNPSDAKAANSCVAGKGTLVEYKGDKYCRTDKAGASTALPSSAGPATALPQTQRR
ncbi:MAG: hypothetical protein EPO10_03395 [Reyranella sp.]|uniref:hypothetical protein n=1 Tax=Reyranella sp. TaxID=1929291 RepID=UPI0012241624|nr:hypothetical protein [Reyranella sp.]TAJ97596.1 MAG: hypothetical protein EPO41_01775 [Reyranella sp.]TBR30333.1 MAG: hypothetical protein EPO10_03395 [Reyranella sp.]